MRVLAIDTSTRTASVALWEEGRIVLSRDAEAQNGHGSGFVALLDGVLKEVRWELRSVDRFGVGVGPGSFTGTRIGVSVLKGILLAVPAEIVAVTSFEAVESGLEEEGVQLGAALPAGKGELFVRTAGEVAHIAEARASAWFSERMRLPRMRIAGEGAKSLLGPFETHSTGEHARPSATHIANLAGRASPMSVDQVVPYYVRPPDITVRKLPALGG